jgi:membrane protein DedA with SNARE-associated domain
MAVESALIPLPSEITMPFAGSLVATGRFDIWLVSLVGALGNLVGSWLAYFLGFFSEQAFVERVIRRYGKYLLISKSEFHRAEEWFKRHGEIIVFTSRLLPAIRTYISLPAGLAKMDFKKFSYYTLVGSLIWSWLLAFVGQKLGENWHAIGPYFHRLDLVIGILLAGGLFVIYHRLRSHPSPPDLKP